MRPFKGDIMGIGRRSLTGALGVLLAAGSLTGIAGSTAAGAASGPKHGGSITYALEAETGGGYCLPGLATLAASGIEVATSIYDTLTTINNKGQYVPFLAQSVTPNATFDQWTITLRPNIKFHNGEALDAAAVKMNLDTYRNLNPKISSPLGGFTFKNVTSVDVTGPLTLVVGTKTPWPAFPALLFGSGRTGIVAPAQLADPNSCSTNLIGTGPFKLVPNEYRPNEHLIVERNPNYWRPGLPYLDKITFIPSMEAQQQLNGLQAGDYDIIQTSAANNIFALRQRKTGGQIQEVDTNDGTEVGYGMLNVSKAPFDDMNARLAVAYAGDANQLNQIRNHGLETLATGPFAPGTPYYLTFGQAGLPKHNVATAKKYAALYAQAHGGQALSYTYLTGSDPQLLALAELTQQQDKAAGISVDIKQVDQATMISIALSGNFQFEAWRNHAQSDPDTQYVWWYTGSPVNFGRINDPIISQLLDQGRSETNAAKRVQIYRQLNKEFASKLWNLWAFYVKWSVGAQKNIGGLGGAPLPDGHGQAFALFAGVVPTATLFKK
jgi:peptide/nickel transport system substrate-binding protein